MASRTIALGDDFEFVGESGIDERKRLSLAKALAMLKTRLGEVGDEALHFKVYVNHAGQVLLEPAVSVPVREMWLYRNPAALAKVRPRAELPRLEQVFVRDGDRCWIVRLPDIFLLESEGNYTRVCFGSERPLIRRSLNALQEQLDPALFFRAGRKQIINLKWIDKVDIAVGGGLMVTLRGGRAVDMFRRQSARLREILSL